ncbi:DUF2848 domain-containing protein [Paenalcaligenes niemegkensis]|uniref:DUF2848 domain-containing protein n=1 Tax=Paenalcaligenes niemegkensis TaxID=2895469 RepID=UPI001EE8D00E|nr:DUF2848 domain-containing protein [Paenalcaligenes niemegkensis]MCQ9617623.1 DUF2848 domain-containing protein [Paenalcaligenes niemegkensis]
MQLTFTLHRLDHTEIVDADFSHCIIAGWAGRDMAAIEHHIEELAELGVPRPSAVPLYYRVAANQLSQESGIQAVGASSSGEAEVFVFSHGGELLVSLASDHTDRDLEAHSVALSKQICAKPVAKEAWLFADVANHWDELILKSWIIEDGKEVLYQDGPLSSLQNPLKLIKDHFGQDAIPAGTGMTCGTVGAIGGIRPSATFIMELYDPHLERSIRHRYELDVLPEIA